MDFSYDVGHGFWLENKDYVMQSSSALHALKSQGPIRGKRSKSRAALALEMVCYEVALLPGLLLRLGTT